MNYKLINLLVNIGVAVVGFFAFLMLQNALGASYWVILIFAAIAAAGYFLQNTARNNWVLAVFTYMFTFGCIFAFLGLIKWLSDRVLPSIQFNSFFKGLLLFIGSLIVFMFLAEFVKKGVKAIIAFKSWKADPAWNFQTIVFGFLCLIGAMWWISGIVECGIAGALSFLGIVLAFVPNSLLEAITSVPSSPEPDYQPSHDEPERMKLDDGTILTNEYGHWMDEKRHEWKEEPGGGWSDQGYR